VKALLPLRSFELLDRLVNSQSGLETVFIELRFPIIPLYDNFHPVVYHHMTAKNFFRYGKFVWQQDNIETKMKMDFTWKFWQSLAYRKFFPGIVREGLKHKFPLKPIEDLPKYVLRNQGYQTLQDEMKEGNNMQKAILRKGIESFQNDTLVLTEQIKKNRKVDLIQSEAKINASYLSYLHLQIERCKKNDINLIFIVPPRMFFRDRIQVLLKDSLISKHTIDLGDSESYPEFYLSKHSFDAGHFNERGAHLFTKRLAAEFLEKY
jgi:hypothetical protein